MRNAKGFALVEIIVVIVIIAVLAGISVPAYYRHVENAKEAACIFNRSAIARGYKVLHFEKPDLTIEDVLEDETLIETDKEQDKHCPSGGAYSFGGGLLLCTYHAAVSVEEPGEEVFYIDFSIGDYLIGEWAEFAEEVRNKGDKRAAGGKIFTDDEDAYVVDSTGTYTVGVGQAKKNISELKFLVKINTDRPILDASVNMDASNNWDEPLIKGDVCKHNGKFYVYKGAETTHADPPPRGAWVVLR